MVRIAVLGAGIVGLSTAVNIQNDVSGADVTIISEKFDVDTTSDGAAGIFLFSPSNAPGIPREQATKWMRDSFAHFSKLATSDNSCESGCVVTHGYVFGRTPREPVYEDCVFSCHELTSAQKQKLNRDCKHGYLITTCLIESRKYLPWLMKRFKDRGGNTITRKITDLNELVGMYDIVVNCTGFGSRELLNDDSVFPVRGQVIRVEAPWVKYFQTDDEKTYIYPASTTTVIGGVRQKDNFNRDLDPADTRDIKERVEKFMPNIKGYTVKKEWVGLRPFRTPIRIEAERRHMKHGTLPVVHNYGHGANGIATSWGTAIDATKLVRKFADHPEKLHSKL